MRIAIVGGGITGLAAAYELELARRNGEAIEYTLFESQARLGGFLASETVDGAVLERGPDSFLTEKPAAAQLCRELGLGAELTPSNDADRKTYIVVRNRLIPLPDGLMFLVPTKLIPTALTPLFSLPTKIRMGLELLHPPRPSMQDEPVASLVERHFGREAVERLADPLLSGIFGGDASQLSARTVLPRLVEMETEYGSLTRGMLAAHRKMRSMAAAAAKKNGTASSKPAPRAIFTALRGGMSQLVEAVAARLAPGSLRLSAPVSAMEKTANGWKLEASGAAESYDAVIMATPAWSAGALLAPVDRLLSAELRAIFYSSSITVNLIYDESQLGRLPDGFGFLVPAIEGRSMLACTFVHRKFLGRTPTGKAVFRAFLGGMKNEELMAESDETLVATVRRELSEILGESVVCRSAPIPSTGKFRAGAAPWRNTPSAIRSGKQRIAARVAALPGLRLAGNAYDGIGIPDCIRLGRQAAKELLASRQVS